MPKSHKKTIKGFALVHLKRGNIMYISDTWYSPVISSKRKIIENDYDKPSGYKIVPITISYFLPIKKK